MSLDLLDSIITFIVYQLWFEAVSDEEQENYHDQMKMFNAETIESSPKKV